MSLARCGICNAPSMAGPTCKEHWGRLLAVLDRAIDIAPVLDTGAAKGGESVVRSTTITMPISVPVMDARKALGDALSAAQSVLLPEVPRLTLVASARLLRAHARPVKVGMPALQRSWVAPVLLAELEPAVAQAVQAVDKPRGRMSVPGRCRECGPSMLHLSRGVLVCDRCGEKHTVGEIRKAVA